MHATNSVFESHLHDAPSWFNHEVYGGLNTPTVMRCGGNLGCSPTTACQNVLRYVPQNYLSLHRGGAGVVWGCLFIYHAVFRKIAFSRSLA